MASIRQRDRKDGTTAYLVQYKLDGRQGGLTFDDPRKAAAFKAAIEAHGAKRALDMYNVDPAPRRHSSEIGITVAEWINHHIDHLTGVDPRTVQDYQSYLRTSIEPTLGSVPLAVLSHDDVRRWVQSMEAAGASPKTIANKHGFLSAALGAAVGRHIDSNPAAGNRLPRGEKQEMTALSGEDFTRLLAEIPECWRPLVRFLAASGARWSEVTALRPSDVNRKQGTVRISRAWKRGGGGYRIGPPKTRRSVRTINISSSLLGELDYTGEWLFTNPGNGKGGPSLKRRGAGGPVRAPNFRANVWWPAVARAKLKPPPRIHDLRHTHVSWLIQSGTPLPVVQRRLGHESINTTVDVYGHLDRRSDEAAAKAIDQLLN